MARTSYELLFTINGLDPVVSALNTIQGKESQLASVAAQVTAAIKVEATKRSQAYADQNASLGKLLLANNITEKQFIAASSILKRNELAELRQLEADKAKIISEAESKIRKQAAIDATASAKAKLDAEKQLAIDATASARAKLDAEKQAAIDAKNLAKELAKAKSDIEKQTSTELKTVAKELAAANSNLDKQLAAEAKSLAKIKSDAEKQAAREAASEAKIALKAKSDAEKQAAREAFSEAKIALKAKSDAERQAAREAFSEAKIALKAKSDAERQAAREAASEAKIALKAKSDAERQAAREAKTDKRILNVLPVKPNLNVFTELNSAVNLAAQGLGVAKQAAESFFNTFIARAAEAERTAIESAAAISNSVSVFKDGVEQRGADEIKALIPTLQKQQDELTLAATKITGVNADGLIEISAIINRTLSESGVKLEEVTQLSTSFGAALATAGVPANQIRQEIQSILTGNIDNNSVVAKNLGITNAQITAQKEQGTLVQFILDKTQSSLDAQSALAGTFTGATNNLQELFLLFTKTVGAPVLEELAVPLRNLASFIDANQKAFLNLATAIGDTLATGVKVGAEAFSSLVSAFQNVVELASDFNDALLGLPLAKVESLATDFARAFLAVGVVFRDIVLVLKTVAIGFQELEATFSNALNPDEAKRKVLALDDELKAFAANILAQNKAANDQSRVLGEKGFTQALQDEITKRGEARKAEADAIKNSDIVVNQKEANLAKLKTVKETNAAELEILKAQVTDKKTLLETEAADGTISAKELANGLREIDTQASEGRIKVLEGTISVMRNLQEDAGKDIAKVESEIANERLAIARNYKEQLIADFEEAKKQLLQPLVGEAQKITVDVELAQGSLDVFDKLDKARETQMEREIAAEQRRGELSRFPEVTERNIAEIRARYEEASIKAEQERLRIQLILLDLEARKEKIAAQKELNEQFAITKDPTKNTEEKALATERIDLIQQQAALAQQTSDLTRALTVQDGTQKLADAATDLLRKRGVTEDKIQQIVSEQFGIADNRTVNLDNNTRGPSGLKASAESVVKDIDLKTTPGSIDEIRRTIENLNKEVPINLKPIIGKTTKAKEELDKKALDAQTVRNDEVNRQQTAQIAAETKATKATEDTAEAAVDGATATTRLSGSLSSLGNAAASAANSARTSADRAATFANRPLSSFAPGSLSGVRTTNVVDISETARGDKARLAAFASGGAGSNPVAFANGGIVGNQKGGSVVKVAEAGRPELILPLNQTGAKFVQSALPGLGGGGGDMTALLAATREGNALLKATASAIAQNTAQPRNVTVSGVDKPGEVAQGFLTANSRASISRSGL